VTARDMRPSRPARRVIQCARGPSSSPNTARGRGDVAPVPGPRGPGPVGPSPPREALAALASREADLLAARPDDAGVRVRRQPRAGRRTGSRGLLLDRFASARGLSGGVGWPTRRAPGGRGVSSASVGDAATARARSCKETERAQRKKEHEEQRGRKRKGAGREGGKKKEQRAPTEKGRRGQEKKGRVAAA